ncbi:MAG TPA: hypothetical protein VG370_25430 [Chloroflexota bacterium]|jgi:hypothetical protein|nr:hypothetical protein [Chloroflexota bacterium]
MLNDKIIRHVLEILIEEHGPNPGGRSPQVLEELIRKRAAQINTLIAQMQDWVHTDDVEFDAVRTLLEHLPSVLVRFESPLLIEMQLPLSEMMLAISDTARPTGEVEGLEVVPNDCPEIQEQPEDDLGPFRKAFEEK